MSALGGRPTGPVRHALAQVMLAGLVGPVDLLAQHTGWPPEHVRRTLKEMRRAGQVELRDCQRAAGRRGRSAGVFGAPLAVCSVDALAFACSVWR